MESGLSTWVVVVLVLLSLAAAGVWASGGLSGRREDPGRYTQFQVARITGPSGLARTSA
jgi:hypothetical protein